MTTEAIAAPARPVRWKLWTGRVLSALPSLLVLFSASMKLSQSPQMEQSMTGKFGFPPGITLFIGLLEVACLALYLIPQTAVFGAILLTGYLGGAVATHVRLGEPFAVPLVIGILFWAGLYLREGRLTSLLPLRR
jgi:hypothetical protein